MPAEGTFILADIGGYTGFLTGVGIEHGKEITSHLLNSLLKCNRGRWKLANIEGDCIFFYRRGREPPDELLAHVRALYEDFRGRITDIAARSSCPCGACSRTSELRLKFIVHAGEYDTQRIGSRTELIGPDVVTAHRLLKNGVPVAEYALLTQGLAGGATAYSVEVQESLDNYEDVGPVHYVYIDLGPVREEYERVSQVFIEGKDARVVVKEQIAAPPELVWRALTETDQRRQWQQLREFDRIQGEGRQLGEVHRCVHGDGTEMVHVTVGVDEVGHRHTEKIWIGGWMSRLIKEMYSTMEARPLPDGRTLACFNGTILPRIPVLSNAFIVVAAAMMRTEVRKDMESLRAYCEQRAAVGS